MRAGAPVWSGDVLGDNIPYSDEIKKIFLSRGSVAALAVPFRVQGKIIGALVASDKVGRTFSDREVSLLQTFASQAGLALEQARLHEETERRRRQAEELAQVVRMLNERLGVQAVGERIVEGVRRLLKVMVGVVFRLRADGSLVVVALSGREGYGQEVGHVLPPGVGVVGQAVMRGEPVCCADILQDSEIIQTEIHEQLGTSGVRALLAIPLRSRDRIIGALGIGDQAGRAYTETDIALLQTFADQAALALENARLYEETRQRLKQTEMLLTVSQTVGSTLELAEVARRTTRELVLALGADIGGAWSLSPCGRQLIPLAGYHIPKELMQAFASTPVLFEHPLVEEAAHLAGPIYSSDSQSDLKFDHPLAQLIRHKSVLIKS